MCPFFWCLKLGFSRSKFYVVKGFNFFSSYPVSRLDCLL